MTQPSDKLPALRPNRYWRDGELFTYSHNKLFILLEVTPTVWSELFFGAMNTRRVLYLSTIRNSSTWKVERVDGGWEMDLESTDPPFELAEALYDAAK